MKKLDRTIIRAMDTQTKMAQGEVVAPGSTISILPFARSREEAIEAKLKTLETRLLGIKIGSFEVVDTRDVWVPYNFLTYHFDIERRTIFNKTGQFDKHGEISLVFDRNEHHPFHYDEAESGKLGMRKLEGAQMKGVFLEPSKTEEAMFEKAEWYIQNRILKRVYSMGGTLSLKKNSVFYRGAVEIIVAFKGGENFRYAYLDKYGIDSEHIFGLKYRLG